MRSFFLIVTIISLVAGAEDRTEHFDSDPHWDGRNNRSTLEMRKVIQDFGYAPHASPLGAIGGTITPDGHVACYALPIAVATLDGPKSASGNITIKAGGGNVLLGFFNSQTLNEWRTPNTLALRVNGRGETFHVHTEFTSAKWRATAGVIGKIDTAADRVYPIEFPCNNLYPWTLVYDPAGNGGTGVLKASFNHVESVVNISPELRADGARFDRFGLLTVLKHADGGGVFFIGSLVVNGNTIDLTSDPHWEGIGNHASFLSDETRPRFNFGYSPTSVAGGEKQGEFGGLFFRGDCRYPERLAYYGAKTETLNLLRPLRASGKIVFKRGVSDSTSLFGFFHSEYSVSVSGSQKYALPSDFAGFAIEGPSAEGFFAYPVYRMHGDAHSSGYPEHMPRIYPDGAPHDWQLIFEPKSTGGGTLSLRLDRSDPSTRVISAGEAATGATFDRFGFVSPWIDGNGQIVYLDDVTYTFKQ